MSQRTSSHNTTLPSLGSDSLKGAGQAERASTDAQRDLDERAAELQSANYKIERLEACLKHETTIRQQAQESASESKVQLAMRERQQSRLEQETRDAERESEQAQSTLRNERSRYATTQRLLEEHRTAEDERYKRDTSILQEARGKLARERAEHTESKNDLSHQIKSLRGERDCLHRSLEAEQNHHDATRTYLDARVKGLEDKAKTQHQAVAAFLKHCSGSSSVVVPSVPEIAKLHSLCDKPIGSLTIPGLPTIVIARGRLPAEWSYLSFASAGVLTNSRFNQQVITPAVSLELPYIHDTLARVVNAVANKTMTVELQRMLIVLLQGIAYVHLAAQVAFGTPLTPSPRDLLEALAHLDRSNGSVLGMVHQRVYDLVHYDATFTSWVFDEYTGGRLDSAKTALPQGVVLLHQDTPGSVFMVRLATEQQLFIIDEQDVDFDSQTFGLIKMRLPPVDGLPNDLRQMDLVTEIGQSEAFLWALRIIKGRTGNM